AEYIYLRKNKTHRIAVGFALRILKDRVELLVGLHEHETRRITSDDVETNTFGEVRVFERILRFLGAGDALAADLGDDVAGADAFLGGGTLGVDVADDGALDGGVHAEALADFVAE